MKRKKSDKELQKILEKLTEGEKHALRYGLLPKEKIPENLTQEEFKKLMKMNPKKPL